MAAHQLHEPHAVGRCLGLDVRRPDRFRRLTERRLKPEALVDIRNVVVDRLGDAHDRDLLPALGHGRRDLHRPADAAVAPDYEQGVDVHPLKAVDDLVGILAAARGAEDRAAVLVDRAHTRRREVEHVVAVARDEALVAVAKPVDPLHAVVMRELHHEPADHVVEPRAEAAAGDDAHPQLRGIEEDAPTRACRLESGERLERTAALGGEAGGVVEEHAVVFSHVVGRRAARFEQRLERRIDPAGAERLHGQIGGGGHEGGS